MLSKWGNEGQWDPGFYWLMGKRAGTLSNTLTCLKPSLFHPSLDAALGLETVAPPTKMESISPHPKLGLATCFGQQNTAEVTVYKCPDEASRSSEYFPSLSCCLALAIRTCWRLAFWRDVRGR